MRRTETAVVVVVGRVQAVAALLVHRAPGTRGRHARCEEGPQQAHHCSAAKPDATEPDTDSSDDGDRCARTSGQDSCKIVRSFLLLSVLRRERSLQGDRNLRSEARHLTHHKASHASAERTRPFIQGPRSVMTTGSGAPALASAARQQPVACAALPRCWSWAVKPGATLRSARRTTGSRTARTRRPSEPFPRHRRASLGTPEGVALARCHDLVGGSRCVLSGTLGYRVVHYLADLTKWPN